MISKHNMNLWQNTLTVNYRYLINNLFFKTIFILKKCF